MLFEVFGLGMFGCRGWGTVVFWYKRIQNQKLVRSSLQHDIATSLALVGTRTNLLLPPDPQTINPKPLQH